MCISYYKTKDSGVSLTELIKIIWLLMVAVFTRHYTSRVSNSLKKALFGDSNNIQRSKSPIINTSSMAYLEK